MLALTVKYPLTKELRIRWPLAISQIVGGFKHKLSPPPFKKKTKNQKNNNFSTVNVTDCGNDTKGILEMALLRHTQEDTSSAGVSSGWLHWL